MRRDTRHDLLNIVKWISENEITLLVEEQSVLEEFGDYSIKYYKHPKVGSRVSDKYFYIRYKSNVKYSSGPYKFPDNPVLESLCTILSKLDFVFWGTFKTEIAPLHFMESMQRKNKIDKSFLYIEAGEDVVKSSKLENA